LNKEIFTPATTLIPIDSAGGMIAAALVEYAQSWIDNRE
jgi:hypothetical protein